MKPCLLLFLLSAPIFLRGQGSFKLTLSNPPDTVSLLGEGFVSTSINERDFAISPDGTEIYFTITTPRSSIQTIVFSKKMKGNRWSPPEVVPFAGKYSDLEPAFSADGKTLFFASNRPTTGTAPKDFDIWKVTRSSTGWSQPENLGTTINSNSDEFYPSIAKSGNLYFTAMYEGGVGKEDIYMAKFENGRYQRPVALDTAINSKRYDFNAFISPEEDLILFTSYGRRDDNGGGDLYIAIKDNAGSWKKAVNLRALNSNKLDYCPYVSPDGKVLFFSSERADLPTAARSNSHSYHSIQAVWSGVLNGAGNIYWIDFQAVREYID